MTTPSFEKQLARLEQIAAELDRPDVSLDAALKLFEEGLALLKTAGKTLEGAEGRLKELVERADGALEVTDGKPLRDAD